MKALKKVLSITLALMLAGLALLVPVAAATRCHKLSNRERDATNLATEKET